MSRRLRVATGATVGAMAMVLGACGDTAGDDAAGDAVEESSGGGDDGATEEDGTDDTDGGPPEVAEEDLVEVATAYADGVYASYDAVVTSTTELMAAVDAFVAAPDEALLTAARDAWLTARDDYGPTEAFRFYDGPIDDPETGLEGQINAWPMDEVYVDYVDGDPDAGIVNDADGYPEITIDAVLEANEEGGETNISTGWHAVEFLLWGQDLDDAGPGARPATDYTAAANAERRATYLRLVTEQLLADVTTVRDAWEPDADDGYRDEFLADPTAAVTAMFRGVGALSVGELAGERMAVAFETKDQEDEHSCFSDNTVADVRNNIAGVARVWMADYDGAAGPGLVDLVAGVDPALADEVSEAIDASAAAADAFPGTFETMIAADEDSAESVALLDAIVAVEDHGDALARAGAAIGITVNVELE